MYEHQTPFIQSATYRIYKNRASMQSPKANSRIGFSTGPRRVSVRVKVESFMVAVLSGLSLKRRTRYSPTRTQNTDNET